MTPTHRRGGGNLRSGTGPARSRTLGGMCGIVGYVGPRPAVVVVEGLRRLEYRGYDSAGVAVRRRRRADRRQEGRASSANLDEGAGRATPLPRPTTGIGHTRWATHGGPTDRNAHPHRRADGRVAVVHNGIIENFAALRAELEADGRRVASETDTEVVAHLLAAERAPTRPRPSGRGDARGLPPAARARSRWSRCTPTSPDAWSAARRNSPAGGRRRRGRELPRLRRRRLHRAHPGGHRARPGPGRRDHRATASRSPTSTARPRRAGRSTSTGTPPPPRRAATTGSCSRRSTSSRRRSPTPCSAGYDAERRADARRDAARPRRSCATSTRSWSSPAAPPSTPG